MLHGFHRLHACTTVAPAAAAAAAAFAGGGCALAGARVLVLLVLMLVLVLLLLLLLLLVLVLVLVVLVLVLVRAWTGVQCPLPVVEVPHVTPLLNFLHSVARKVACPGIDVAHSLGPWNF